MPIRPEMKKLYPPPKEWKKIRASILERANHSCECLGECGVTHAVKSCAVPNGRRVRRFMLEGREEWSLHDGCSLCLGGDPECKGGVIVVLTIGHRDHNPENNDPANLAAWCQRCHLRHDKHEHAKNSANTRRRKHEARTGQQRLGGV